MTSLAKRVEQIKPSFTLEMVSRAADLKSKGIDLINFSAGQPDFNTPNNIIEAAKKAMDIGKTKYTAGSGTLDLRNAICLKIKRENKIDISPSNILVSNGEKQSLSLACQALFQLGDQVLIFKPYWVSFPEFVCLADAKPVFIDTKSNNNFEPDQVEIESKISDSVKGIIINSPSNPTGSIWSDDTIIKILKLAKTHNWVVISDECYELLVFDGSFTSAEKLNQDFNIGATIVTCMSMSKTYSMTGWRIGYSFGQKIIIDAMNKIQGQSTSCANSISQAASVEALIGDQSTVVMMLKKFKERRDLMVSLLNKIRGVKCNIPGGAFYAFPKVIGTGMDGNEFARRCMYEAGVAIVPGTSFGKSAKDYVRFSFAASRANISEALEKIKKMLA